MIITEVTRKSKASKEAIWKLWSDVDNWYQWDGDVLSSSIQGQFITGTIGVLKPKDGPKTKFKITKTIVNTCFTNRSTLPLCTIDFIHEMYDIDGKIEVSHRIEMKGLLAGIFSKIMGENMTKSLPHAVENLINMAENEKYN